MAIAHSICAGTPPILPVKIPRNADPLSDNSDVPYPWVPIITTPLHKNIVPKVRISEGIPIFVTNTPFKKPTIKPPSKATNKPKTADSVEDQVTLKSQPDSPIIDEKERSISPQIIT